MPRLGFEPIIPVFELAKTVHAFKHAATVTGFSMYILPQRYNKQGVTVIIQKVKVTLPITVAARAKVFTRTLGSWVRIPVNTWMSVLCAFIVCSCCSI
jgi:hypothetical protein